uniref:Uncharacterized protein n=1 Tax=Haptolina brevifila TaxID=156173 RepID=A0A7S2D9P8_9EUKA|mmetsp:Transcript_34714/g.69133  ORF Transcript_34714/g.69133 Transcript_34714/m.69133 type:complete len:189 (+) Transcript_34714:193-759(+)
MAQLSTGIDMHVYMYVSAHVHQHTARRGVALTVHATVCTDCAQASFLPAAKAAASAATDLLADENMTLVLSLNSPEDALTARLASHELRRHASDDELWRAFFGELLSTFPAVSSWPLRGATETCVCWYFRCRAYGRWAQGVGEAYHNITTTTNFPTSTCSAHCMAVPCSSPFCRTNRSRSQSRIRRAR